MVNNTIEPHCHSDTQTFWIIFLVLKGIWLIFGAGISILIRNIIREYNDFSAFAYAIYNNVILIVIAIPLALLIEEVPNGVKIISVVIIVLAFSFTTVILFFDTWQKILFPEKNLFPSSSMQTFSTKSNSGSANSATASSSG